MKEHEKENSIMDEPIQPIEPTISFYDRPRVKIEKIPVGPGVILGIETVSNPEIGIGGAYGTWGESVRNEDLPQMIQDRVGDLLKDEEKLSLSELGFYFRQLGPKLSPQEHVELEVEVGKRFLTEAAHANGWEPKDVDAILIGASLPPAVDFIDRIAAEAGIPDRALKVSIHKACDGSVAGLNMALNPNLPLNAQLHRTLAKELFGKKVLVGGIEGLSRIVDFTHDKNALQFFGNGAGVIGLVPGETMKFLVGTSREAFDNEGVLQVRMFYPHSKVKVDGQSMIEVFQNGENHIRVAGLMHEPEGDTPVLMAGMMGMVKLFVRNGVQAVQEVYQAYHKRMADLGMPGREIVVAIVHHANLKINQFKVKNLQKEGIQIPFPWLIKEFGNVSAASNMIAFLRKLSQLNPGDHILFDGFGAGSYYDVLAVELGGQS
jgi:3-oxoacyl-[acyl-carrier-protein] synthase III